jgi:ribonuclease HI
MSTIVIYTDGGARGNPGPAAAGFVIKNGDTIVAEAGIYLGDFLTNNSAEYEALFLALQKALELNLEKNSIEARLDSKLVVEQVMGRWKIKEPNLKIQCAKIKGLIQKSFTKVTCVYIPREQNKRADALVNEALDSH